MAFVKTCDNDGKILGGDVPFIQTKGSISDQLERNPTDVRFRYLTDKQDEMHTFCNDACEMAWREGQRNKKFFTNRV